MLLTNKRFEYTTYMKSLDIEIKKRVTNITFCHSSHKSCRISQSTYQCQDYYKQRRQFRGIPKNQISNITWSHIQSKFILRVISTNGPKIINLWQIDPFNATILLKTLKLMMSFLQTMIMSRIYPPK